MKIIFGLNFLLSNFGELKYSEGSERPKYRVKKYERTT